MASPPNALVHRPRASGPQSAQNTALDVLLPTGTDGTVTPRGQLGLSMSQLTQRGGKAMESVVSPIVNLFWGPHRCRSDIKKFFGEDDPDRRQAALDSLHTALQHTTRDCLSPKQKALWKASHELLNYARQDKAIDTQILTFKILVTTITRYPGLRRLLYDHKDVRNRSEEDFDTLWIRQERQVESCGEEWVFYRTFAAFSITENALTKLVEAAKPSELALVSLKEENLNKVPIEELLGWCKFAGLGFDPPRLCAIRYVGGILALPSFWDKGGRDEKRFFVVLSDVCDTMFELLRDTEATTADTSVDTSPSMSAARDAVDILCTVTFEGLLRLRTTNRLPRNSPVRLPDIISLLGGNGMKAIFPTSSAIAPSVGELLSQPITAHPSGDEPSLSNDEEQNASGEEQHTSNEEQHTGYSNVSDPPPPESPEALPEGILLSANVVSFHFELEDYWFRVDGIFQPYATSPGQVLPPAKSLILFRVYNDFYDFQVSLLDTFPREAGRQPPNPRILPYMPGPAEDVDDVLTLTRRSELDEYVNELCKLSNVGAKYILEHQVVREFLAIKPGDVENLIPPRVQDIEALFG